MAKQEVTVVQGWSGGPYGSREPGETFEYDLQKDDADLAKLGLVKPAPKKASEGK